MNVYYLFLNDEALLVKAYILKKFILSLTSQYMKKRVFIDNSPYVKKIYNEELDKFKLFYTNNKNLIDCNIDKIKYTIYHNFENDFEDKLKEALELEPVNI